MKSRGIAEAEARAMLIEAFFADALEQVQDDELAAILQSCRSCLDERSVMTDFVSIKR